MARLRRPVDALVGERLRLVRKRRRMTLGDVETVSDGEFRTSVLGAYERGERSLRVSRLLRLAEIYDVLPSELLTQAAPEGLAGESHDLSDSPAPATPGCFPPDAVL